MLEDNLKVNVKLEQSVALMQLTHKKQAMTQMFLSLLLLYELHMSEEAQRLSHPRYCWNNNKKEKFHLKYLYIISQ